MEAAMPHSLYRAWMRRLQEFLAAPQPRRSQPANRSG
jgi:hypothetical protein